MNQIYLLEVCIRHRKNVQKKKDLKKIYSTRERERKLSSPTDHRWDADGFVLLRVFESVEVLMVSTAAVIPIHGTWAHIFVVLNIIPRRGTHTWRCFVKAISSQSSSSVQTNRRKARMTALIVISSREPKDNKNIKKYWKAHSVWRFTVSTHCIESESFLVELYGHRVNMDVVQRWPC